MNPKTVADVHCATVENTPQKERYLAALPPALLTSSIETREDAGTVLHWLCINQKVSRSWELFMQHGFPAIADGTEAHYEYYGYIGAIGGIADDIQGAIKSQIDSAAA